MTEAEGIPGRGSSYWRDVRSASTLKNYEKFAIIQINVPEKILCLERSILLLYRRSIRREKKMEVIG